ncbi:hypothetical protein F5X68DRAFT_234919 [Plectosphaerella plurivora]|uniref:Uncharacterized protein n=1 Tax=Plectosphaerella plurivora TaxID=936078 RepID=A0A9P9A7D5_9PEZI|nr:hypothetical protein F5X68DRAFT_234919 [Plectosphaerella plurivora]
MPPKKSDGATRQVANDMKTLHKANSYSLEDSLKTGVHDVRVSFQLKPLPPICYKDSDQVLKMWTLEETQDLRSYLASRTDFQITEQRCIMCHKDSHDAFKCEAGCSKYGLFCSDECRKKDSARHDDLCIPMMSTYGDFQRPTTVHRRVFIFMPNELKPRPIWLRCEVHDNTGIIRFKFDQEEVLRWASERGDQEITTWINSCGGQHTTYTIGQGHGVLLFGLRQASNNRPWDINRSIAALADPGHLVPEFGPVFVVRYFVQGMEMGFHCFGDASLRDLQHGIDNILASSCNTTVSDVSRHRYRTLPGIKFNDLSNPWNQAMGVKEELQVVRGRIIGNVMPQYVLAIPKLVGLWWLIRPTAVPEGAKTDYFLKDVPILYRWIYMDPHSATEAELADSSLKIKNSVARRLPVFGSFFIYDCFARPFRKEWVEALKAYIEAIKRENGGVDDLKLPVSQEGFEAFWETFKATLAEAVPSPWEKKLERGCLSLPTDKEVAKADTEQLRDLEVRMMNAIKSAAA